MDEFFVMGGYGFYVWSAYGIATVVLLGLLLQSIAWSRSTKRRLRNHDFS
jgi:heme exporter protein D